jgi:hypothetical protein
MAGEVVSADGGLSIVSTVRASGGAGAWDFGSLERVRAMRCVDVP